MKPKKTKKANLNNYSFTFMLIGLVTVLYFALQVINLKTYAADIGIDKLDKTDLTIDKTEVIIIEKPKPKIKRQKPRELARLKVEKNEKKVEESIFKNSEPEPVDTIDTPESLETENVENYQITIPFSKIEQVPVFPGCEKYQNDNDQLRKCMNEKIHQWVSRKFNTGLAEDMGLSGEKVRIFTQFTIDTQGNIVDVKARSKYKDLEKEARRVIGGFPKMKPGKQRNRTVKVTYTLPIVFKVAEE